MAVPGLRRALATTSTPQALTMTLRRGDLTKANAEAIVTSANDSLIGNGNPTYWRFISRTNVDGKVRKLAGPELAEACLAFPTMPRETRLRRDITRWTSGVKKGSSALVRCPAGSAISTPAFGSLHCNHIIHAVAPDSEFGYEGMYTGGVADQLTSGAVAGVDTPTAFAGGHSDGIASQQFTPPDGLLLQTYESALVQAAQLKVSSLALCALGAGVKGWKPAISAALGLEAIARHSQTPDDPLRTVDVVLGGAGIMADESWAAWVRAARELLGAPTGLENEADYVEAAKLGELRWALQPGTIVASPSPPSSTGLGANLGDAAAGFYQLPLARIGAMREMWGWRAIGKNGRDEPLTAEQELAAAQREAAARSTR